MKKSLTLQGFDEFYGYVSGNIDYHSHYDGAGIYDWWHNLDTIWEEGYSTDLITRHSVDFINQHKDDPFFLYVAHESPHAPFQGRNDPAFRLPGKELSYHSPVGDQDAAYQEMVEVMDEGIGKIMKALEENKLLENTLIFFISDNGAVPLGNNGVLNGKKAKLLEGGHRVPAIAYWKNNINPGETSEIVVSMDLLPTILAVTRSQVPKGVEFDGIDISNVLLGRSNLKKRSIFWRFRSQKAVRKKQWKLLIMETDTALYNLDKDLGETKNLSDQHQSIVENLVIELVEWEREVGKEKDMKTL
jgi:arylsulfatase A